MRTRSVSVWARGVGLACLLSLGAGGGSAQDEIVARGNEAYQAGEFTAAIEAYVAVLEAGFESADLHYNLGNAYFKAGELGRAILSWERARVRAPGDADVEANLELARRLTVDVVEPMPRFWLISAWWWWVDLVPRTPLRLVVALGWLLFTGGLAVRILGRERSSVTWGGRLSVAGVTVVLVLGLNLMLREMGLGRPVQGVVLAESVAVRSAPAQDDDLTLFEIHEGTTVRVEQRAGEWIEVVLADGKVGWVPQGVLEEI